MNINKLSEFALTMVMVGSIAGVGAIVISALSTAGVDAEATTILGYGTTALTNFTSQLGTVGTVMGVLFLLSIVFGMIGGIGSQGAI